jgi:hypothetical protein
MSIRQIENIVLIHRKKRTLLLPCAPCARQHRQSSPGGGGSSSYEASHADSHTVAPGYDTVLAIDEEIKQVKVQTEEGQRLLLLLDPASLARLHVRTLCLLQVANKATRDTARPPEHEGAFW